MCCKTLDSQSLLDDIFILVKIEMRLFFPNINF